MAESHPTLTQPPSAATRNTRYDIAIVDQSQDAMEAARDAAEARLTAELNADGGRIRQFVRSVWKGNVAKEVYRQRYITEAARAIDQTQDQFAHLPADTTQKTTARMATIERMLQGHDEVIHDEAGESREVLDDGSEIASAAKELVRRYASEELSEEALREEQARVLEAYRATHDDADDVRRCSVQVDNILQVARAVKGAVEHGESLDRIVQEMRVVDGVERAGARTAHVQTATDKAIEKIGKSKLGRVSFLTPEVVVGATAVASSAVRLGTTVGLGNALRVIAPGIAGGVIAGMRESHQVRKESIQHTREMVQGGEVRDSDARRQKMDTTRYETRNAAAEAVGIREMLSLDEFENNDVATVHDVMMRVAELQERRRITDTDKKDLFSYTDATRMGAERHDLDMAIIEAKSALSHKLALDDVKNTLQAQFGAAPEDLVLTAKEGYKESIEQDVSEKDALFKKLRRKRVAQKVAIGVVVGATVGIAAQELVAVAQPSLEGLGDHITGQEATHHDSRIHETLLERVFAGDTPIKDLEAHQVADGNGRFDVVGGEATIDEGIMSIGTEAGVVQVEVGQDGLLSDEARTQLEARGIQVGESEAVVVDVESTTQVAMTADEYVAHYSDDTAHVTRDLWYDNNTLAPTFDLNEQGLHWGGEGGVGPDGQVQLSVATMAADGSFAGNQSVAWQEAVQSGGLKVAISATENTQAHPFMVDIQPDGSINVPADHPAAQLFTVVDGQMTFTGAYSEVVQTVGTDADGVEHVRPLATLVGTKEWDGGQVAVPTVEQRVSYITPLEVPAERVVEVPPIVPVPLPRKSMESVKRHEKPTYYYEPYERKTAADWQKFMKEISPRLRGDPAAELDPKTELSWYRRDIRKRKGKGYIDEIDSQIEASPELKSLSSDLKAIVTIPVHATGEADNIYKTLSLYGQQTTASDSFATILHLNWFDSEELDPAKRDRIQKTLSEIERARQDYPNLKIATIQSVWEQEKKDRGEYGNGIIGHVSRKMYDTAMMSVERAIGQGNRSNSDVLLIRNDADAQGMDRRYVAQMIKNFEQNKEADVFTGAIRWGTSRHIDLPGFAFVSNFREVMHIATHRKGISEWPPTVGINTAIRMSTFAAVGGVGSDPVNTGIGSDDYNIGGRIKDARQPGSPPGYRGYGGNSGLHRLIQAARIANNGNRGAYGVRPGGENYSYHRHVVGATIDTAPDRLEAAYLNPAVHSTSDAWDNWDQKQRSQGVEELRKQFKEDIRKNPDAIVAHVEKDISGSISNRFRNRAHVNTGLAMMLPAVINGQPSYKISETQSGERHFQFTEEGKRWFVRRMGYDSRGRYDPIGRRVRRQKYHENIDRKKLATSQAPYVQ